MNSMHVCALLAVGAVAGTQIRLEKFNESLEDGGVGGFPSWSNAIQPNSTLTVRTRANNKGKGGGEGRQGKQTD